MENRRIPWLLMGVLWLVLGPVVVAAQGTFQIRQAQGALKNAGYDPGRIDGVLGQRTRNAISKYQADRGLSVTGLLDERTLASLIPGSLPSEPDKTLTEQIARIQEQVARLETNTGQILTIHERVGRLETDKDSPIKSGLFLPPEKALDLHNEIMSYRNTMSSIDNIKYYLPPVVLVSLTVMSALAIYFVSSKVNELRVDNNEALLKIQQQTTSELKKELGERASELRQDISGRTSELRVDIKERTDEARSDSREAKQNYEQSMNRINVFQSESVQRINIIESQSVQRISELRNESIQVTTNFQNEVVQRISEFQNIVTAAIETRIGEVIRDNEIKLSHAMIRANNAIALNFWHNGLFEQAIFYAGESMDRIRKILPLVSGDEHELFSRIKYSTTGDLAYYYAENYLLKKNSDDANRALRLARSLPDIFDKVDEQIRIFIIDNYIFTIANVQPITGNDRKKWRCIFKNYQEAIRMDLEANAADGKERFNSYMRFWRSSGTEDNFSGV